MENRKTQPMYLKYKFKHYLVPKNKINSDISNNNKNNDNKGNDKNKNANKNIQLCQYVE